MRKRGFQIGTVLLVANLISVQLLQWFDQYAGNSLAYHLLRGFGWLNQPTRYLTRAVLRALDIPNLYDHETQTEIVAMLGTELFFGTLQWLIVGFAIAFVLEKRKAFKKKLPSEES